MMDVSPPSTPLTIRSRASGEPLTENDLSPFCSRDSGYGSESTSPEKPSTPSNTLELGSYAFDGNSPDLFGHLPDVPAVTEEDNDVGERDGGLPCATEEKSLVRTPVKHRKSSSLPKPQKGRCGLPVSFFSTPPPRIRKTQRSGSDSVFSTPSSDRSALASLRSPDRFVHPRDTTPTTFSLAEKFQLSKFPDELTSTERVLRHNGATDDAFSFSPARFNPVPTDGDDRQASRQAAGFPPLARARTALGAVDPNNDLDSAPRPRPASGSVWSLGTVAPITGAVDDGRGNLVQTGTNAPYYTSEFVRGPLQHVDDENKHAGRLAAALDYDLTSRILQCNVAKDAFMPRCDNILQRGGFKTTKKTKWDGATILSAPRLRDDFYCSLLAYSPTCDTIAVGLGDLLYRWSEDGGAKLLNGSSTSDTWLTSLAFSSDQGGKCILAFGRSNCMLGLLSMFESGVSRMLIQESSPISCLSWRPTCTMRPSKNPHKPDTILVETEDLLVGDDTGNVLYYVIEWPDANEVERDNWRGELTLVARISVHYQQICGLAWSFDGRSFATGGNDNLCCFFYAKDVLPRPYRSYGAMRNASRTASRGIVQSLEGDSRLQAVLAGGGQVRDRITLSDQYIRRIGPGMENWQWEHGAAVKAIAFCPWQDGLVATGGGSNDKCVHFFHTTSGAALATIFVSSQVTSLVWSTTRREIAVTFGFAHPSHNVRIAVYSWPECKQVAAIPWEGKHRALYGISCSKGPYCRAKDKKDSKDKESNRQGRTLKEGCIAIASSDESIKFYELWASDDKPAVRGVGMLGGSDILEDMEGIQKDGDIIR
ncbi:WD domain containing protein [Niveomyces insectorum RCEF 264]|uniref:WD domain containing protein n=1 Tax=Niveomyces insectorum RCEF 264 TaxID=1081102 RepID=A0A167QU13_9HYPO|nr:WD domain containing protein [Niveomyces insectorum RCEF 264]